MAGTPLAIAHPDIVSRILQYADVPTLYHCMQVSWTLFDIAGKLLYNHITVDPDRADALFRGASGGPIVLADGTERELKRSLLGYVRRVDIVNHDICDGFSGRTACTRWRGIGIEFPDLEVLRIWVVPDGQEHGWFGCPWIKTFTPTKLVFRGLRRLSAGSPYSFVPHDLLPAVRRIVVVIDQLADLSQVNADEPRDTRKTTVPPFHSNTETVVVFWTDLPKQRWVSGYERPSRVRLPNIIDQLAILALAPVRRLTICNTGRLHPDFFGTKAPVTYDEATALVAQAVETKIVDISRSRKEGSQFDKRLASMRYTDLTSYLAENDWTGEFEEGELRPQPWLARSI